MILTKKTPPKASIVLDTYWKFAAERQQIFYNRIKNKDVLTLDPILLKHKFTNVYRASDRVSQYLINNIIYKGDTEPSEILFRILLFKIFNKIETWELFKHEFGEVSWRDYSFKNYNRVLHEALRAKESIYSGAYIMASGKSTFGFDKKHENHLKVIEQMLSSGLTDKIQSANSLKSVYELLLGFPTIGTFLAYQYAIDLNYSELIDFSEMDFVKAGPGARDGIKKCFIDTGDYSEEDIIRYVTDKQHAEFERLGIEFESLWGRSLQLIDCQNLFCETDKYARIAHPDITGLSERKRIKQIYRKSKQEIEYGYPPKWGIDTHMI
ncbi:nucleotide kinase domain-containing protein [Pedobacter aquatilis]|uniref:nucleotide kinase domain-containing protein n=1 Tax=Pedobacter aquatilis TaxID=351343 RepID=UPI00292D9179|nr:nucleotide kinase domain-containing protein [Pedobacter aquatilis]